MICQNENEFLHHFIDFDSYLSSRIANFTEKKQYFARIKNDEDRFTLKILINELKALKDFQERFGTHSASIKRKREAKPFEKKNCLTLFHTFVFNGLPNGAALNIEKYIQSGILEQYCLGLASDKECIELELLCLKYEQIRDELAEVQKTLGTYGSSSERTPKLELKNSILYAIDELDFVEAPAKETNETIDLSNPPLIHKNSNHKVWLAAIEGLKPVAVMEGLPVHPIRMDDKVQMVVVWVEQGVPAEQHETESESFLILEGSCTCKVGKARHYLEAGDFLGIPTYTDHSLKVTSAGRVKLIVQRVQLVA